MPNKDFCTRISGRLVDYLARNIGKDVGQAEVVLKANRYIYSLMGWKMANCIHIRVETEIKVLTNQIYDLMVNCNNVGIDTEKCGDLCDLQFGNADSYVYEQAFNNAKERAMDTLILDFNGDD